MYIAILVCSFIDIEIKKKISSVLIKVLAPSDRANLIHNLFMNAFANRSSYQDLTDFLAILVNEQDYLPWRTIYKHLNELESFLEYRKSFYPILAFFISAMGNYLNSGVETNWDRSHTEK